MLWSECLKQHHQFGMDTSVPFFGGGTLGREHPIAMDSRRVVRTDRQHLTAFVTAAAILVLAPALGLAQTSRGFVSVTAGLQAPATEFPHVAAFTLYQETGERRADYTVDSDMLFDVGAGARLWRRLSVGVGVSRFKHDGQAEIAARLPHPFFFDRFRPVSGSTVAERTETAAHVQMLVHAPLGNWIDVTLFGGPSFFNIKQRLVSDVRFSEMYPYDTATFSSATTVDRSASAVGVNIGADIATYFTRHLGVGALVRFSRAPVELAMPEGGVLSVDAGGLHVGGGLRLRF